MIFMRCPMDVYAALESKESKHYLYRGDLINTLDTLLEKKPGQIDYVLVEMNGLADPSAIIQMFWVDDGLGSLVTLHQTVALVDSKSFPQKLKNDNYIKGEGIEKSVLYKTDEVSSFTESELLFRQLIYADKILLNKTDLVKDNPS